MRAGCRCATWRSHARSAERVAELWRGTREWVQCLRNPQPCRAASPPEPKCRQKPARYARCRPSCVGAPQSERIVVQVQPQRGHADQTTRRGEATSQHHVAQPARRSGSRSAGCAETRMARNLCELLGRQVWVALKNGNATTRGSSAARLGRLRSRHPIGWRRAVPARTAHDRSRTRHGEVPLLPIVAPLSDRSELRRFSPSPGANGDCLR
jgi:hypothetical protein